MANVTGDEVLLQEGTAEARLGLLQGLPQWVQQEVAWRDSEHLTTGPVGRSFEPSELRASSGEDENAYGDEDVSLSAGSLGRRAQAGAGAGAGTSPGFGIRIGRDRARKNAHSDSDSGSIASVGRALG